MVAVQASKIPLSSSSSSAPTTSLLFDPTSLSLALTHSDSSLSLYPSLLLTTSPLSLSSLPPPQTLIPSPTSSALFLLLQEKPTSAAHVLFVVAGPHREGSQTLLRFYALNRGAGAKFARPKVVCKQKGLTFEPNSGVSVDCRHGASVKLSGSVNFFSMYSTSSSKVWVFAVKIVAADESNGGGDGLAVKLMKCAEIECCRPVWSICVAFGLIVFGEENGVSVFNLRSVSKGHNNNKKVKNSTSNLKSGVRGSRLRNGVIGESASRHLGDKCNCVSEGKIDKHCGSFKQKVVKLKQEASAGHARFISFEGDNSGLDSKSPSTPDVPLKAASIQALSAETFMVLDSSGDLHFLRLPKPKPASGPKFEFNLKRLPRTMKVQHVAALPDSSMRAENIWVSDGHYSVHIIYVCDMNAATGEIDGNDVKEKPTHISVREAIFTSEKIQALIPVSSNSTLILGQGSIYAYTIS